MSQLEDFMESERRATAYHEAGHAIAHCLFGEGEHLDYVTLIERGGETGRTQLRPLSPTLCLFQIPRLKKKRIPRAELRHRVTQLILNCFVGPAAECQSDPELEGYHWYQEMLGSTDEFDLRPFAEDLAPHGARADFDTAFAAAVLFVGRYRNVVWDFLHGCAIMTDQMVADETIWKHIDELARELLVGKCLFGSTIHEKHSPQLATFVRELRPTSTLVGNSSVETEELDWRTSLGMHRP